MAVAPSPKPLHIAIVGGGIGGAVLSVALTKYPHITFTIYESRSAFGEIGFRANSHRAMSLLNPAIWEGYKSRASFNGWEEKENICLISPLVRRGRMRGRESLK
jgi:salicylate hydroxylase